MFRKKKKSFNQIMSSFFTAKKDLEEYVVDQDVERVVQLSVAEEAIEAANLCIDNIKAAERSLKQLSKIIG